MHFVVEVLMPKDNRKLLVFALIPVMSKAAEHVSEKLSRCQDRVNTKVSIIVEQIRTFCT